MNIKNICNQFNIVRHCRSQGVSLWQCPQFLFLIMGLIIITSALSAYAIGNRYITEPRTVVVIVLLLTMVLFIIDFIIVRSFEKLAAISRMKSEFINVVSHQLRSPLTNVTWALDIILCGDLGQLKEGQKEYLKIVKENAKRMHELVNDLLTVSRLEQGTLPLRKKELSLVEIINQLVLEFKPHLEASNIKIEFFPSAELPKIIADASQIKLVIENLVDNAIKYIRGKGEIKIRLNQRGNYIFFEIEDNGVGIPKQDQKYIFQKFFRSENVMRQQTEGSGLGLFIVKSIVERSGGKIWFKSEEEKGTTFYFTLPIK